MTFNSSFNSQLILLILLVLIIINIIVVFKSRSLKTLKSRLIAIFLRLPVFLIAVFILINPTKEEKVDDKQNKKVFLIDKSLSMSLGNHYTRYDECLNLLNENGVLNKFKDNIYYFDSSLNNKDIKTPDGSKSNLGKSFDELLTKERVLSDIIIMSDGAIQDKNVFASSLKKAIENNIRVSTFTPKVSSFVKNIAINKCYVDQQVLPLSDIMLNLELQTTNLTGEKSKVIITDNNDKIVLEKEIKLVDGRQELSLDFKAGLTSSMYKLSLSEIKGEISHKDNHVNFAVDVKKSVLKVLYMEGSSDSYFHAGKKEYVKSYEFMTEAMTEAEDIEVDLFLMDTQTSKGGRLFHVKNRNRSFPTTKKELFQYDVVICSDINRFAFSEEQLEWVRELVAERGGGFCMIGGNTSFGSGNWNKTVWEKMIPVDMGNYASNSHIWSKFKNIFAEEQINHPILKISDDKNLNKKILQESYNLLGTNRIRDAKPGAVVLAYMQSRSQKMPIIVVQSYGKGRSMAFTSDSAGGWGGDYQGFWGPGKSNNDYYKKFWTNTIHWLAAKSIAHKKQKLSIYLDKLHAYNGDLIDINVKDFSENNSANNKCLVYLKGHKDKAIYLEKDPVINNYNGKIKIHDEYKKGEHSLVVEVIDAQGNLMQEEQLMRILDYNQEFKDCDVDNKYMSEIALSSSGFVINNRKDLKSILAKEPKKIMKQGQIIWDRWWLITIMIMFLSCEWFYRKLHN